ncbi:MAG: DUF6491 family protein [Pseudomonas sp.]
MNKGWSMLLAVSLLAGCATGRLSDQERLQLYRAHAGAPVADFRYSGRLDGWIDLGDSALAVWSRPNQAYLLELDGPCGNLAYSPTILITSLMDRVSARFDRVQVIDGPRGFNLSCRIQSIRPLDVKALKASEKELREAGTQSRVRSGTQGH